MKRRLMTLLLLGALTLLSSGPLFGAAGQGITESFDNGRIDWSNGTVRAEGMHAPNEKAGHPASPEAREHYVNRAIEASRANLSAILRRLTIHGETTGSDVMDANREVLAQVDLMFLSIPITEKRFLTDGSVQVTLTLPLRGAFSQLILPEEIRQINPIRPLFSSESPETPAPHGAFTGLIVDARGVDVIPGLAPRLVTESGEEVYGPTIISREYAVQRGVATYESTLARAGQGLSAGENPLMVTGIGTTDGARTDIIISSQDAARIRSDVAHTTFLSQCRVVIVLDPPQVKRQQ
ncbi:hypothetical protein [Desulfoluna spongiiphila]|uniref:LPP20 lipoprotein n=1 Tax=Desulfoluna spongiiphila TaxID=419481 RepID=A0A1G5JES9_9BACT|nr:hypothetical protein [Desulfoluna spongiiphila]SCY86664.1 hypothetical protein SAMN05216233_12929 [Desulfoluna spongiiphila]